MLHLIINCSWNLLNVETAYTYQFGPVFSFSYNEDICDEVTVIAIVVVALIDVIPARSATCTLQPCIIDGDFMFIPATSSATVQRD